MKYSAGQPFGMNLRPIIENDTKKIFISEITARGRAHNIGLQVGDQIISVNDVQVQDLQDFKTIVQSAQINKSDLLFTVKNVGFIPNGEDSLDVNSWLK